MRTRYALNERIMAPIRSRFQAFRGRRRDQRGRGIARVSLPPLNRPPPKSIQTIRLDDPLLMGSSGAVNVYPQSRNFCASWLAKNSRLPRPKIAEVMLDDRDETAASDEITVLSETAARRQVVEIGATTAKREPRTSLGRREAAPEVVHVSDDEEDNSVVFLQEMPLRQIDPNMPPNYKSTSRENSKIADGFSKECQTFQRQTRFWTEILSTSSQSSTTRSAEITICSYNVLCQKTVGRTSYLYRHLANASRFLEWNYRWNGLKMELPSFGADILGLQEVQADHYADCFEPLMRERGYEGAYKQKFGTELKDDGCAIFWRPEKFNKIRSDGVNYFVSTSATSNRENIGQILTLQCRTTGEVLIVANTHLLFNEERGDVKLAQLAILFANIHKIREQMGHLKPVVVVMGDFNIEPYSKVYEFIVNGRLHVERLPVRTMSGQSLRTGGALCSAALLLNQSQVGMNSMFLSPYRQCPPIDGNIYHPFEFVSAYHHGFPVIHCDKRAISTFHKDVAAPDFIFFTPEKNEQGFEKMQLVRRYALPTIDMLSGATPWPNQHVPSDHLPIIANFLLHRTAPCW